MQQGDYPPPPPPYYPHLHPPPYHHHPPPPPPPQPPTTFASAPPFSGADYPPYSPNYPSSFPHIPDPTPPPPPPPPPPQQPPQQYHTPPYYPPFDPHQSSPNYPPYDIPQSNPSYPPYDPQLSSPNYPHSNPNPNPSSTSYVPQFDSGAPKYEHGSGYFDENLGGYGSYGSSRSNLGGGYDYKDDGVYAYEGKTEPYGARGTMSSSSTKSSNWSGLFDDYGRAISFPKDEKEKKSSNSGGGSGGYGSGGSSLKVVRAVPKVEDQNDVKGGVQKFRVKLLPESGGQSVMDVLCMVGLDGIRMLDPNTSRTLRIYPLETVTRCDKFDSSTFAFWSKTSVDVEPRRIRLQSNSYTTNTILDTVTAATVQFKEMGGRTRPSEFSKASEPPSEKKKGLGDWIYKLKPVNEEKDHWVPDEAVSKCTGCGSDFSAFNRRHHCRNCGDVFCDKCTQGRTPLTSEENAQPVRVCDRCMAEVTHRLSKAKEAASRPVTLQSHEDLAKKLQEEMEKNLRISSGTKSESSGKRMREVACPTCTVHLQVQVPSSGSETIECGVCQHPFIVSAH